MKEAAREIEMISVPAGMFSDVSWYACADTLRAGYFAHFE